MSWISMAIWFVMGLILGIENVSWPSFIGIFVLVFIDEYVVKNSVDS